MKTIVERKQENERRCQAAVKAKDFTAAAKAAADVADCAEILASRTTGVVAEAYAKEVESWRSFAKKLQGRMGRAASRGISASIRVATIRTTTASATTGSPFVQF